MKTTSSIAKEYFSRMARRFPVMCLSDEFYFFPRAQEAVRFLHTIDSLDRDKIDGDIAFVKKRMFSLEKLGQKTCGLEERIDRAMLRQSMATFLREFGKTRVWRRDPALYVKIALFGIDHLASRIPHHGKAVDSYLLDRMRSVPRLLREARANVRGIPSGYLEVAIETIDASCRYFRSASSPLYRRIGASPRLARTLQKMLASLEEFKQHLKRKVSGSRGERFIGDRCLVEEIVRDSFSYGRSLEEIFETASSRYHETLAELKKVAAYIDSTRTWQEILSSPSAAHTNTGELIKLYEREIERIKTFLGTKDLLTIPATQDIRVKETPLFMKPVRASASYSAPLTDLDDEILSFYVTADYPEAPGPGTRNPVHDEYMFVTAHETYPGHHLLDSMRRRLANPIRRQIESPLFYEGWASYAERLLHEFGYFRDPRMKLLGLRRRAWRAVRAMLDVGSRTGALTPRKAERMLEELGYARGTTGQMIRHYALLPGYQLCYTMGEFEIGNLRNKYVSSLGVKGFHDLLLRGGQMPFDLLDERMRLVCKKSS